jgi:8-oxo-dGTP pyrophosphatase MutT (NUDIX family)
VRECREETGLTGRVAGKIDTIKYTYTAKWEDPPEKIFKIVTFYLIEHTGGNIDDHDWEVERVEWFPVDAAIKAASYRTEKAIIQKASTLLANLKNQDSS